MDVVDGAIGIQRRCATETPRHPHPCEDMVKPRCSGCWLWMPADLAPVYLDDTRVTLQGDPRPKVAKILQAGGLPKDARVVRVEGRSSSGRPLGPDEVIDRTGDTRPVH